MTISDIVVDELYERLPVQVHQKPWSKEEFVQQIENLKDRYHDNHPLNKFFMDGKATQTLFASWAANRYYYQATIPLKDSAILANCPDIGIRQLWIKNVINQDSGGLERWLEMCVSLGLAREDVLSFKHVLPGVKFACDAYLNFAKQNDYKLGIASCLTINFASDIHSSRVVEWPKLYPFLDEKCYSYFKSRMSSVKHEKDVALDLVCEWFKTSESQAQVIEVIKMKQDILWCIMDSIFLQHFLQFVIQILCLCHIIN